MQDLGSATGDEAGPEPLSQLPQQAGCREALDPMSIQVLVVGPDRQPEVTGRGKRMCVVGVSGSKLASGLSNVPLILRDQVDADGEEPPPELNQLDGQPMLQGHDGQVLVHLVHVEQ